MSSAVGFLIGLLLVCSPTLIRTFEATDEQTRVDLTGALEITDIILPDTNSIEVRLRNLSDRDVRVTRASIGSHFVTVSGTAKSIPPGRSQTLSLAYLWAEGNLYTLHLVLDDGSKLVQQLKANASTMSPRAVSAAAARRAAAISGMWWLAGVAIVALVALVALAARAIRGAAAGIPEVVVGASLGLLAAIVLSAATIAARRP
ncbi:MAG: hypothetical protein LLG14_17495 [Nocardiaceae bacterium]|nr:hypothetical protein [Nocardiaceae bacterium]